MSGTGPTLREIVTKLISTTRDAEFCFSQLWSILMPDFREISTEVQNENKNNYLEKVLVSMETASILDLF